ncbi:MAG: hypothetical protein DRQ49_08230 [Gammaproteobacteria bacterium]|nr:MAG: hypothetical protein DRQ41_10810 [Gammaproteobacteria bacterium]RKZ40485.1 MAG: hypothetical protein DRQ49_08230 [Gammaproteobacteria bacterium]RKZ73135.1 MAG: hypothetical protein DRQ57_15315 [Gammaproteobacteria bacterium]
MVRNFYKEKNTGEPDFEVNFNRAKALSAIKSSFYKTLNIYSSLKVQLPIYEHFILNGIKHPLPASMLKVLVFFQYVGILLPKGKVNQGEPC